MLVKTDKSGADLFGWSNPTAPTPKTHSRQAALGQFLTPNNIAAFLAGLFPAPLSGVRLLDAGAGKGALSAAFVERWKAGSKIADLVVHAYELDEFVLSDLRDAVAAMNRISDVDARLIEGDFVAQAAAMVRLGTGPRYTHAVLNPPYRKIGTDSEHRALFRAAGLETVNLYSGFVGLALALLEEGGELVAIIPRSFCNGPYYLPFRQFIFARAAVRHIHLFGARNKAFKADGVLQENVVVRLTRGARQGPVTVSTSTDETFCDYRETSRPFSEIVIPGDQEQFIHIPVNEGTDLLDRPAFGHRLADVGLSVSTGPVVDFRMKDDLRADPEPGAVPLLYPAHFTAKGLDWPKSNFKKANAILHNRETAKWLFPAGFYTVVRRFSSKEERRRVVASVVDPTVFSSDVIGFENHLNVVHDRKKPLTDDMAHGIATFLNSTGVDRQFRRFNGHTQVNATDLRNMGYPSRDALLELGRWAKTQVAPSQDAVDEQVAKLA